MAIVKLKDAGAYGFNFDHPAYEIDDRAWSGGNNVAFQDGFVTRTQGYSSQFGTAGHAPYGLFFAVSGGGTRYLIYPGLLKIRAVQGTTHYDITRSSGGDYGATADLKWTGGVLTGIVIVNNSINDPQFWAPQGGGNMALLTNWPANTKCGVLRPYRSYLVALDITESSTRYPYRVKWSAEATAGSLPASWDETSTTNDSGEYDLGDTQDFIVDAVPFADALAIYREQSIYLMRWIGGQFVMSFQRTVNDIGMLANNCAAAFKGGHAVLGQGDFYVFNGSPTTTSIIDGRMRSWLFNNIDSTNFKRSFVVGLPNQNEIWACFPLSGATSCTSALVWNYRDNTLAVRDLPNATCGVYAQIDTVGAQNWTVSGNWSDDTLAWNADSGSLSDSRLVIGTTSSKLMVIGVGLGADSASITSTVERSGIALGDAQRVKYVREVWPRFEGSGSLEITIGTQMSADEAVAWGAPATYTIGTSRKVDVNATGRFIGLRIRAASATDVWRLKSLDVDVTPQGRW